LKSALDRARSAVIYLIDERARERAAPRPQKGSATAVLSLNQAAWWANLMDFQE
jgi:hypothetical protein